MVSRRLKPQIERMLNQRGVYFLHDPRLPDTTAVIFSAGGALFNLGPVGGELDPDKIPIGPLIEGPLLHLSDRRNEAERMPFQTRIEILEDLLRRLHAHIDKLPVELAAEVTYYLAQTADDT